MLPTFNEAGDIVVVDCLHVKLGRALQKGDIVIAKSPTNPGNTVCKRVLGLVRGPYCVGVRVGVDWETACLPALRCRPDRRRRHLTAYIRYKQPGDRILIQPQYWYQQEQVIEVRGVLLLLLTH